MLCFVSNYSDAGRDRCDSGHRYEQSDARAGCSPCSHKVVSKAVTALY